MIPSRSDVLRNHGFRTSLDIAREQTYTTTTSLAGSKRSRSDFNSNGNGSNDPAEKAKARSKSDLESTPTSTPTRRLTPSQIRPGPGALNGSSEVEFSEYSQRKAVSSTPGPDRNPLLSLQHHRYGLPRSLIANFASLGVNSIYPWQASCLLGGRHLQGDKNLIYTAPTGGGKSLVADVLMLKKVIENPSQKAILVLPYVALVQEKLKWIRRIVEGVCRNSDISGNTQESTQRKKRVDESIRVTGFFGGSKTRASWSDTDIAANALINTAIEECTIDDLGVVVLDELHMLDDESRGYLIELMVTKLLLLPQHLQIVGMSATLSNTELLASWLDANLYISRYRPVPIEEFLVYENSIFPAASSKEFFKMATQLNANDSGTMEQAHRIIDKSSHKELEKHMPNAMVALALETANSGYGALVFCGSRHSCQTNAMLISQAMPDPNSLDPVLLDKRTDLVAHLQSLPCGLDPIFEKTVIRGVAFHHAGLTTEERELIADGYDKGVLKVLVATCSLAAGINLPARRVILCGARMGRDLVGPSLLRQMRGRAGRKGKDEVGETYLCCQKADLDAVAGLLEADIPAIESCLAPEKKGVKRALLEAITTRLISGREAVNDYVRHTLLYRTIDKGELSEMVDSTLQELLDAELLSLKMDGSYEPTQLGQAIVGSSFSPEDGLFVYAELKKGLQAFVMDGEMHVFYMFTPVQMGPPNEIDWPVFRDEIDRLDESGIRALQFVGVKPGFVNSMAQSGGTLKIATPEQMNQARIYWRAYTALQLRDVSNEVPLSTIAQRYNIPRGNVQNLAQTCHGFAAGMVKFCQRMGWGMLAAVFEHMRDRLQAGARADLLEMAQVAYVKSRTARILWENGFKSVRALAEANPSDLVPVLMMAQPRKAQGQKYTGGSEKYNAKLLGKAEIIVGSANKLWERQVQVDDLEE
ncbi:hypothetical protein FQN54_008205 [Arachnomyces sp. PD_36]|nr:hypothetical protein FQN54_008205 [Arachnomyces sp. PD_36]